MKRTILLFCAVVISACSVHAQDYTLDIVHQPYAELSAPVTLVSNPEPGKDLNYFIALPGFSFRVFDGKLATDTVGGAMGCYISVQGVMGGLETPGDSVLSLYGFWSNTLTGRSGAQSSVSYQLEGTPGSAILKVQWKNMGFTSGAPGDSVNFQIWLHEQDNAISYHYGPSSVSSTTVFGNRGGPVVGFSKADPNFTQFYRSFYLDGPPANPSIAFPRDMSVAMNGVPPADMVYIFRQPTTSTEEPQHPAHGFRSFPLPFREVVTFTTEPSHLEYHVVISDMTGRETASASGRGHISVRCDSCTAGVYLYRIMNGGQIVKSGMLVAE